MKKKGYHKIVAPVELPEFEGFGIELERKTEEVRENV